MKTLVAGGSGFLGRALTTRLAADGHDVVILSRRPAPPERGRVRTVVWQPDGSAPMESGRATGWAAEADGADAVVNLAGEGIADRRWTSARKRVLLESRTRSTRSLVSAVRSAVKRPPVFISASAIGYYGNTGDEVLDESSPPGSDFFAGVCVAWEAEARAVEALNCRVAITRSGVVLSRRGGALKKMLPAFQLFVGGPVASGQQYMSWISLNDWIRMILWIVATPIASGVFNATAPDPVTNAEFSKALGRSLHRPSWLAAPGFALRLLFGEIADAALINGQRVLPKHALALGFTFAEPTIDAGMSAAMKRMPT